jgi:thymidylate kinase
VAARPLAAKLSRLENSYYERIAPPDVLIVMKADPAEAVERRPDQDREFVRRRAEEIYQRDWSGTPGAHVVDANRTHTEVLEQVRSLVWASL